MLSARPSAHVGFVVFLALAAAVACEKAPENKAPVPAGPATAARVEIPSGTPAQQTVSPISTKQVCDEGATPGTQHGAIRPLGERLWGMLLPSPAYAQFWDWVAKMIGDAHLQTIKGFHYDFQAVGEFVALKTDVIEIQSRLQPFGSSRIVSVTTAIAVQVGGDIVAVYAAREAPLWVNHKPAVLNDQVLKLPNGGELQRQGNGFVISLAGKFEARILYGSYLDQIVTLCPPYRAAGLLGTADAAPKDSLTSRAGDVVQLTKFTGDEFNRQLYHVFGDSWRIAQKDSLFDYESGQSTQTFTDLKFPYQADAAAAPSSAQQQNADAACRKAGIATAAALADCILDVSVTGDLAFAENDALAEAIYDKSGRAQKGVGSWQCGGTQGEAGWECEVHALTGARVGSTMTLMLETLQSGRKQLESLNCGPITESYDATCSDKTQGIQFQGMKAIERFTLRSGELWEINSHGTCDPAKSEDQPC